MPLKLPSTEEAPTVALHVALDHLGIGKTTGYALAATGQLAEGVPVIKVGAQYRVPTAPLRRALGLDDTPTRTRQRAKSSEHAER